MSLTESPSLVERARRFGDFLAEGSSERDAQRRLPYDEMRALAAAGLLAARVPRSHGGPEASFVDTARAMIEIARGDPNVAQAIQPHLCGLEKIRLYGTPAQQDRFFAVVTAGGLITNASAERGGGKVGDLRTVLRRDPADRAHGRTDGSAGSPRGWLLKGVKHYSTGSLFAQWLYILTTTEDGGRAIALVPVDRAGVTIEDDWDGMGQRTTASGTTTLDDVRVADDEVLHLPQWGQRRTHEGAAAQVLHAAIDTGIALAALADAVQYGRKHARPTPESGVERATDDFYVQHSVGEMAVAAHGAAALVERGAALLDVAAAAFLAGDPAERLLGEASVAIAEAKWAAGEASLRVSENLYRIGGASATVRSLNLDRHWRNARTHTTHDPASYKAKAIGDFYLNDRLPPISTKI